MPFDLPARTKAVARAALLTTAFLHTCTDCSISGFGDVRQRAPQFDLKPFGVAP
jgi:hypothetical protein